MTFHYPYKSKTKSRLKSLVNGQDYYIWSNGSSIDKLVAAINGPIIEIGGPSELGFYFLEDVNLLVMPVITNISSNPVPFSPDASSLSQDVTELIDARKMPYKDNSVGIYLMSAMSLSSDWWAELDEDEIIKAKDKFEKEYDIARLEMGQVALGVKDPKKVVQAQRVQIYQEVYRTLRKNGLLFSDGGIEEIDILKRLGFELISFLQLQERDKQGTLHISYEFVVAK